MPVPWFSSSPDAHGPSPGLAARRDNVPVAEGRARSRCRDDRSRSRFVESIAESAQDRTTNRTGGRGFRLRGIDCAGWSGQVGVLCCAVLCCVVLSPRSPGARRTRPPAWTTSEPRGIYQPGPSRDFSSVVVVEENALAVFGGIGGSDGAMGNIDTVQGG